MTKVVLLCGGYGTRLSEETAVTPKPLVEIGHLPIMCHIMNSYSHYGFKEFFIALGYKGAAIKQYFMNFHYLLSDLTIRMKDHQVQVNKSGCEDWIVHLTDTGLNTTTGGRLHRLRSQLQDDTFMVTYGDGVSDINLQELLDYHRAHGKLATVTAVKPRGRFGTIELEGNSVSVFKEKVTAEDSWINGGFFVFEPGIFDYLSGDQTELEREVLSLLARDGQLAAYRHEGFWECMDTLRDKRYLESLWEGGNAPWKPA